MHPTLFTIGKVSIPSFTVLLDLGLILGLVLTYFEGRRQLRSAETGLDLGLWTVIGGIVGGRIGYVLTRLSTFSEDWGQAFRIWKGGLSFTGAFLGGLLVLAIFALLQRRKEKPLSFWNLADVLVPGLALGLVFGWAACLMGGCAYGAPGEGFGCLVMPDLYGVEASRVATQVFGLALAAALFVVFWLMRGRWPFPGAASSMFGLLYFGGMFLLEFWRADEAIYLGLFRLDQIVDLVLALAGAAALVALWWLARRAPGETEEAAEEEGVEEPEAVEEAVAAEATEPAGPDEAPAEVSEEAQDLAEPEGDSERSEE